MNTDATIDKFRSMRLNGVAEAYHDQRSDPAVTQLSFDERFGMLVESHWLDESNRAMQRRLCYA